MNRIILILLAILVAKSAFSTAAEIPDYKANLHDTLLLAQKSVETFWNQIKSVTCVEKVTQEKFGKHGNVESKAKSTFDYLVLLNVEKDGLSVDESRLQQGKEAKSKNVPFIISSGLPTLFLVFHPYYEESFRYQLGGDELVNGRRLARIKFSHIPGTRSTTALRLRGKNCPLDLQGNAWVDTDTGVIHRIEAGLSAPMIDLNLKSLEIEVGYYAHNIPAEGGAVWLPSKATVEIQTERQRWRNTHQYSSYKKFTVNTENLVLK